MVNIVCKPFKEFRCSIRAGGELRLSELHGRLREVKGDKNSTSTTLK